MLVHAVAAEDEDGLDIIISLSDEAIVCVCEEVVSRFPLDRLVGMTMRRGVCVFGSSTIFWTASSFSLD